MANGDLNKELILLQKQLEQLGASPGEIKAIGRAFKDLAGDTSALSDEVDRVRKRVEQLRSEAVNLSTPFADLNNIIQQNAAALSKQNNTLSIATKAQNKIANISRDMVSDYQGLTDLSKRQLETKLQDLQSSQAQLSLQAQIAKQEAKELQYTKGKSKAEIKRMNQLREVSKFNAEQDVGLTGLIAKTKERLALETSINENMGVAGALVGGTGALMERLGMRSGIFNQTMSEATAEMRTMAKDMGTNVTFMNKLKVASTGVKRVLQGFGKALLDPTSIGLKLLDTFFKINKQSVEISRLTGQLGSNFDTSFGSAASMVDQMEVVAELTKQTGINAQNAFSQENIAGAANLKVEMGLAANEAGNLAIMAQTSGTNVDALTDSIVATTSEFNGANRSAISQGVILRDIGNVSEGIRASFSGNTEALVKGAAAARRLGMDIENLDNIASSLMDFESSIQNELEAQLLTGKNINLAKARELALSNDLEGLGKELLKNSSDINEFGKMNRIQQEAQAKALGMTRDQLARVAYQRALDLNMTEDQAAAAAGVRAEDMKRITAQENFAKALEKIASALAPILDFVGNILSIPWVPQIILGAVAAGKLASNLTGIAGKFGGIVKGSKDFIKTITSPDSKGFFNSIKEMLGGKWEKIKEAFDQGTGKDQDIVDEISDKAKDTVSEKVTDSVKKTGDTVGDLGEKTKDVKADSGAGIRGFLTGLGDGLASIGKQAPDVIKGSAALFVAGLALGGSFALALMMVKDVDPAQMLAFAGSLSMLGLTLALLGKVGGQIIQGALALGILGVGLIPAAYAFSLLAGVDAGSMFAFAGALSLLGLAAAGLGFLFPYIAMGAGALALLGLALIPATYGFSLIQGLDMDTILGFAKGVGVLAATTAALGLVAPLIMYGSLALAALGLALIPLSYGFAALGDTPIESIVNKLQGLATLAPQLLMVGAGLMSIAAGLGMIAIAGIAAIPALSALSMFALVAAPLAGLAGLFGEGGGEEDGSMAEISAKLDTLIEVISSGGDVYLDGDNVGMTQAKSITLFS